MKYFLIKSLIIFAVFITLFSCSSSDNEETEFEIINTIKKNTNNNYKLSASIFRRNTNNLPIGIFDSGTGGLAVLETIISIDQFNNQTHMPGSDGIPDFVNESFIYLADEANMPYGRYSGEGKSDFLRELVIKDVAFLLGNSYYQNPESKIVDNNKSSVKEIVIACNTATAFGLETVIDAVETWDLPVKITGIIEAGARSALEQLNNKEKQLIAILATEGTVASEGYAKSIFKIIELDNSTEDLEVIQRAGFGLAGSIDGDNNYVDINAISPRDTSAYFGPDISNTKFPIDLKLWESYNFNTGYELFIVLGENGDTVNVQLNSVENYTKYMVTHLVMDSYSNFPDRSIDAVILGCTHYPFVIGQIRSQFQYLKSLQNSASVVIPDSILFIDPSVSLAAELYQNLKAKNIYGDNHLSESSFYISVPNTNETENKINTDGEFTFKWKYGRSINTDYQYVKVVPFSDEVINSSVLERIELSLPNTYKLIK